MPETGGLPPKTMLKEQYLLLEVIGQGGMGAVYKAKDTKAGRVVAVKEMAMSKFNADQVAYIRQRFYHEAVILSKISHPNIPRFYDYFHEAGRSYIVMECIMGETLERLQRENPDNQLPILDMLDYTEQICKVLDYLHHYQENGGLKPIIYRDLKPSNIIITKQKKVYLIDFGIARFLDENNNADPIIMCTEGYSPPEQFENKTIQVSDLFSLGATLFVCLTGHNPKKNVPTIFNFPPMRKHNRLVPPEVEALLRRLLATQEADRPQSAELVLQELEGIKLRARDITNVFRNPSSSVIGGTDANFYDEKTARAAQYRLWLLRANKLLNVDKLPGLFGRMWATYLIPALSHSYGAVVGFLLNVYGGKAFLDAFSEPVWTPHFWFIFLLSFLVSIGGSAYLINSLHTSSYVVAFFLAIALMVFAFTAGMHKNITSQLSRSVLLVMSLMPLLLSLSLLGLPAVQHALQTITLNQLLSIVLVVLGALTLIRPEDRLYWLDHITLAAIAAVIAIQQTILGPQVWQQLQLQGVLAADQHNHYSTLLIGIPVVIGIVVLLNPWRPLGHFSRIFLLALATLDLGSQLVLGKTEILPLMHGGTRAFQLSPELLYTVLALGPIMFAFFSVFLPLKPSRLGNGALFVLACSLAYMQNQVGIHISFGSLHSYPLTTTLPKVFSFYQLVAYGLVALAIILFFRFGAEFARMDYIAIFGVAMVTTVLQFSVWFGHTLTGYRFGNSDAPLTMLLTGLNEAMALGLVLLVVTFLVLMVLTIFFKLSYHSKIAPVRFNKQSQPGIELLTYRIFHILLVCVSITCVLLFNSFGQQELFLTQVLSTSEVSLTWYDIIRVLLVAVTIYAFTRLFGYIRGNKEYGRSERFVMLVAAVVCAFLLFGDQWSTYIPLVAPTLPQSVLSLPFHALVFVCALITAGLALLWLRKSWQPGDRGILLIFFSAASVCALFQVVQPALLVPSLILLIQGLLLATQIEKVR